MTLPYIVHVYAVQWARAVFVDPGKQYATAVPLAFSKAAGETNTLLYAYTYTRRFKRGENRASRIYVPAAHVVVVILYKFVRCVFCSQVEGSCNLFTKILQVQCAFFLSSPETDSRFSHCTIILQSTRNVDKRGLKKKEL